VGRHLAKVGHILMIPFDSTGAGNHDIPFSRVEYDDHYTVEAFRWLSVLKWDFILWKIMVSHNDLNLTNIIDGQQINQTKNHYSPQHASIRKKHICNICFRCRLFISRFGAVFSKVSQDLS
jgi:hypothetical protein